MLWAQAAYKLASDGPTAAWPVKRVSRGCPQAMAVTQVLPARRWFTRVVVVVSDRVVGQHTSRNGRPAVSTVPSALLMALIEGAVCCWFVAGPYLSSRKHQAWLGGTGGVASATAVKHGLREGLEEGSPPVTRRQPSSLGTQECCLQWAPARRYFFPSGSSNVRGLWTGGSTAQRGANTYPTWDRSSTEPRSRCDTSMFDFSTGTNINNYTGGETGRRPGPARDAAPAASQPFSGWRGWAWRG